jgi:hypothetical protein
MGTQEQLTIHIFEIIALDKEIHSEWATGKGQLTTKYTNLFSGQKTKSIKS